MTERRPLIRRFKGADGSLTTFLPTPELAELVGVAGSTVTRWAFAGCVRSSLLRGKRYTAVVDAAKLRLTKPGECGEVRTPPSYLKASKDWFEQAQRSTIPTASKSGEEWDSYELCYIIDSVEDGATVEDIATKLNRTWSAVENIVQRLRQDGDLPARQKDDGWLDRTLLLLTAEEVAELSAATEVAAAA